MAEQAKVKEVKLIPSLLSSHQGKHFAFSTGGCYGVLYMIPAMAIKTVGVQVSIGVENGNTVPTPSFEEITHPMGEFDRRETDGWRQFYGLI